MSTYPTTEDATSPQQLVTKTRDLTLITPRRTSSPVAESGDATPWESAEREATTVDAQPTAVTMDFSDPKHPEFDPGAFQLDVRPAAGQSPGRTASSGQCSSALSALSTYTQRPHKERAADAVTMSGLGCLPNEVLTHILTFLDVSDLLATSRINHHFRNLCLHPLLHVLRIRRARVCLSPLLTSRPTLAELIARHIFLTHTTLISRRLARNLVAIRLSRRLPLRPSAASLVERGVLPPEVVEGSVAPGLVAKKRAVEKERLKDNLRRWVGAVWRGEVRERSEGIRKCDERVGVGRVWRLRKFWERVGRDGGGNRRLS
ncbi:hypothetical protein F4821DRAFT_185153 [Hypoxylon rubiginosum]|uniref:Uncharacterized protein n=1 Tax=Hypoxylon rubiginosum TaxID=110542 RepID=A0ACC0DFC5_9PEZI|nr:hypothetical protein F4821DRAFT_185153 [Hypoxylon rubiginosum]